MDKMHIKKFNKYENAGVREYRIVEPDGKIVSVFVLESYNRYGRPEIYTENDILKVSLFPGRVTTSPSVKKTWGGHRRKKRLLYALWCKPGFIKADRGKNNRNRLYVFLG